MKPDRDSMRALTPPLTYFSPINAHTRKNSCKMRALPRRLSIAGQMKL